jgi:hypothetical protein
LLRSRNFSKKNGGLGADADHNFGWLLKFSCVPSPSGYDFMR